MTPPTSEFDDLPPEKQAAIEQREAVTQPIYNAVTSLDLTWEIARGNLADLERALRPWEGVSRTWRTLHRDQSAMNQGHHRLVLRRFHNFLGSAASAVWHAERIVARLIRSAVKGSRPPNRSRSPNATPGYKNLITIACSAACATTPFTLVTM